MMMRIFITPGLNVGVPWPTSRFTVTFCDSTGPCAQQLVDCDLTSSNDVVMDNLTGLVVWGGQIRPYILEVESLEAAQGKVTAPGLTCVGEVCTGRRQIL